MKKPLIIIAVLAILVIGVTVEHYYGDNIYGAFAFAKSDVVQISENQYRVPKDNPEVFNEYMHNQGWTYKEQLGSTIIFENKNQKAYCTLSFKDLYAQYDITYETIEQ